MELETILRVMVDGVFLIPFSIYVRLKMNHLDSKIDSLRDVVMALLKDKLDGG